MAAAEQRRGAGVSSRTAFISHFIKHCLSFCVTAASFSLLRSRDNNSTGLVVARGRPRKQAEPETVNRQMRAFGYKCRGGTADKWQANCQDSDNASNSHFTGRGQATHKGHSRIAPCSYRIFVYRTAAASRPQLRAGSSEYVAFSGQGPPDSDARPARASYSARGPAPGADSTWFRDGRAGSLPAAAVLCCVVRMPSQAQAPPGSCLDRLDPAILDQHLRVARERGSVGHLSLSPARQASCRGQPCRRSGPARHMAARLLAAPLRRFNAPS